jgi:hypothetical protein
MLDFHDDRVEHITNHMSELMKNAKVDINKLEFEAKIGRIEFRNSNE